MHYDSFAPRTRLAAMRSPRSRIAPYFSERLGTFENSLEEFEHLSTDGPSASRRDCLPCVDPSLHDFLLDASRILIARLEHVPAFGNPSSTLSVALFRGIAS